MVDTPILPSLTGKWTILKLAGRKPTRYLCRCQCGTEAVIRADSLGKTSIQCKKCAGQRASERHTQNLAGRTIAKWKVIERASERGKGHVRWLCLCTGCNRKSLVVGSDLTRERSSKCKLCARRDRMPDYTGKTFGEWKAISKHPTKPGIWLCECKCGRKCNVSGTALAAGSSTRCFACARRAQIIGVQGRTFGQLEVEERARDKWRCRCKLCGRMTKVSITGLRRRLVTGGGCRRQQWSIHRRARSQASWQCQPAIGAKFDSTDRTTISQTRTGS